ncbi:hypothetical protein HDU98_001348 [Podochytrium sp. JEL0797]|nr:hypothetical protein HDU98_001348 [Podochytrium sp. JEL0797]
MDALLFADPGGQLLTANDGSGPQPVVLMFPAMVLNECVGFQPIEGQPFLAYNLFAKVLLERPDAEGFFELISKKSKNLRLETKKFCTGVDSNLEPFVRFSRTHYPHSVLSAAPSTPTKRGYCGYPGAATPSRGFGGPSTPVKPRYAASKNPPFKPLTFGNDLTTPHIIVYDSRKKPFDLKTLANNNILTGRDAIDLNDSRDAYEVSFVPVYVVLFERGKLGENQVIIEKKVVEVPTVIKDDRAKKDQQAFKDSALLKASSNMAEAVDCGRDVLRGMSTEWLDPLIHVKRLGSADKWRMLIGWVKAQQGCEELSTEAGITTDFDADKARLDIADLLSLHK